MPSPPTRLEFRLPISPTDTFFAQVRFFDFALRRLSSPLYRNARIRVVVGDHCDLDDVRRRNRWSDAANIVWERVPDRVFDEFHWAGTANWRLQLPPGDADLVILSDADTVLLRDIDPLLAEFSTDAATLAGHMAHLPPTPGPASIMPPAGHPTYWPRLFEHFDLPWPALTYRYSKDVRGVLPLAPAYFNLGFIAINVAAIDICANEIDETTRRVTAATDSWMRCQIALTIIAHRAAMRILCLPASFNAANDQVHLSFNHVSLDDIRVLHYLRGDEIDRGDLRASALDTMLSRTVANPANWLLQDLAREYAAALRREGG